jgi:hypothetical protein
MSISGIGSRIAAIDGAWAVDARVGVASVSAVAQPEAAIPPVQPAREALLSSGALRDAEAIVMSRKAVGSDAVVARVGADAKPGTYAVEVKRLARAHRSESSELPSDTSPLGMAGSIELAVGDGPARTIAVARADSLVDVAVKINTSGADVDASVVYQSGKYKLSLRGVGTGADRGVRISESGVSLGLSDQRHVTQEASDSLVVVDGVPTSGRSNQVDGAIPGVTLVLREPTSSPRALIVADPAPTASAARPGRPELPESVSGTDPARPEDASSATISAVDVGQPPRREPPTAADVGKASAGGAKSAADVGRAERAAGSKSAADVTKTAGGEVKSAADVGRADPASPSGVATTSPRSAPLGLAQAKSALERFQRMQRSPEEHAHHRASFLPAALSTSERGAAKSVAPPTPGTRLSVDA